MKGYFGKPKKKIAVITRSIQMHKNNVIFRNFKEKF